MLGDNPEIENDNAMDRSLSELRKLLSENEKLTILEKCDRTYLKRFLYSADLVAEEAFEKIKAFYDVLEKHPNWFTMDTPSIKKTVIDQDIRIMTNAHDKDGRPVYIVKIGKMHADTMDLVKDVVPVDDFFIEFLLSTYAACQYGICVIIDISDFPWNLLKWLTRTNIKISLKRMQSMPIKEYKLHVVNRSRVVNLAVNIIWPFLPQYLKEAVHFHFEDWDSLHKHIDKEVLPYEFGGCSTIDYTKFREKLYEHDSDIADSLRSNRQPYLNHIERTLCKC